MITERETSAAICMYLYIQNWDVVEQSCSKGVKYSGTFRPRGSLSVLCH